MAILYISNHGKNNSVTVQFFNMMDFEKDFYMILENVKNNNKKCRELNKDINKIAMYNKLSLLPKDFCIKHEKIDDLEKLM